MKSVQQLWTASVSLVLAAALAISPMQVAFASPVEQEAKERFERGVELYQTGDVQAAYIEFTRAHELAPNYRLLFNIGQTAAELKDYVTARESFRLYLEQGGPEISQERVAQVKEEIKQIEQYLAWVSLDINVKDAIVTLDGRQLNAVSTDPRGILVSAGRRTITVNKTGYEPWSKTIDVAGQDQLSIEIELVPLPRAITRTPVVNTTPKEQLPPRKRRLGALFWTGASLTLLFGATGTTLGFLTLRTQERHLELRKQVPVTQVTLDRSSRRLRHYALATDISIGLAATAALVTIGAAIWGRGAKKRTAEPKLRAGIGPRGHLSFQGRF